MFGNSLSAFFLFLFEIYFVGCVIAAFDNVGYSRLQGVDILLLVVRKYLSYRSVGGKCLRFVEVVPRHQLVGNTVGNFIKIIGVNSQCLHLGTFLGVQYCKIGYVMVVLHVFLQYLVVNKMYRAQLEIGVTRRLTLQTKYSLGVIRLDVQQQKCLLTQIRSELQYRVQCAVGTVGRQLGVKLVYRKIAVQVGKVALAQYREVVHYVLLVAARNVGIELQFLVTLVHFLQFSSKGILQLIVLHQRQRNVVHRYSIVGQYNVNRQRRCRRQRAYIPGKNFLELRQKLFGQKMCRIGKCVHCCLVEIEPEHAHYLDLFQHAVEPYNNVQRMFGRWNLTKVSKGKVRHRRFKNTHRKTSLKNNHTQILCLQDTTINYKPQ